MHSSRRGAKILMSSTTDSALSRILWCALTASGKPAAAWKEPAGEVGVEGVPPPLLLPPPPLADCPDLNAFMAVIRRVLGLAPV